MTSRFDQEVKSFKAHFSIVRGNADEVLPLARVTGGDGKVTICGIVGAETPAIRSATLVMLAKEQQATEVVFMSDVWLKSFNVDAGETPDDDRAPSEYPDRVEAMLVVRVTALDQEISVLPYTVADGVVIWGEEELPAGEVMSFGGITEPVQAVMREAS